MPPRIAYLDGPRLRRSLVAACEHAQRQRGELNRINVFPVPDGDTGTNLALTVRAIADHLRGNEDESAAGVAREAAQAAVLGARGNCGMMLSHFLLGFQTGVGDRERVSASEFVAALRAGVTQLYAAIERPVEGTILTVMRETTEAAEQMSEEDFEPLLVRLVDRARDSLAHTPDKLPALKRAGVVDAGAKGFVSLLEGALLLVHGDPILAAPPEPVGESAAARADVGAATERYRFCTEAMVRGAALPTQDEVRARLRDQGDSLIVIRADGLLKIHVHTDQPDDVFAWLRTVGELVTHKAEDMRAQHAAVERAAAHVQLARRPVSVMTDSASDLPEEIVRAHGIHVTPMLLVNGDRVHKDGVDITAEEFHALLSEPGSTLPTTSQPAPADFLETFARAAEDGEAVVGVIVSGGLSGTLTSAQAAAARFHGAPVTLVDSRGASLLQGLLTLKACELGEMGMAPAAIAAELQRVRDRSGVLFTVDVFDRLLASGRVGRGRAFLGSMLSVKPILEINREGKVEPAGKVMGRARVLPAMIAALEARIPKDVKRVRFGIIHVAAHGIVETVTRALRERWGRDVEVLASPVTPVIATHIGPGAWGVAFLVED